LKIDSAEQLFDCQRNLLECLVRLGRGLENQMFEELGKGYEGATLEKGGKKYKFVGYRDNTLHGLFGEIRYRQAYYVGCQGQAESWIPLDERLGIAKRHTQGSTIFCPPLLGGRPTKKAWIACRAPWRYRSRPPRSGKIGVISEAR
jgi:hypothetical protein